MKKNIKGNLLLNFKKFAAIVMTSTLVLAGCSSKNDVEESNNSYSQNNDTSFSDDYDYDLFRDPESSVNATIDSGTSENEYLDIYNFVDSDNCKIVKEPVSVDKCDPFQMFEKYESYNLAYRGIEEMDDSFEGKYNYSDEDAYYYVGENFDIMDSLNKAKSSNDSERENAELKLTIAKDYYKNWLNYNAQNVIDYEEKVIKKSYVDGETVKINYFDDYDKKTLNDSPFGVKNSDAYNAFELFESYNLAYRGIEDMDDEFQDLYSFTPEERYKLISEGFNIDDAIEKAKSSNSDEKENARKQLIMAKQFYKNWLDYNDDNVIEYLEKKIK